jgi:diguanylate cyclase (GGDEF)-like protein
MDLDRFKDINDSLGHSTGDQMLIAAARRVQSCLRITDTLARLGGDEFVILLNDARTLDDAIIVADRIQALLCMPFEINGMVTHTSASIGIVFSETMEPDAGAWGHPRPEEILRNADIAMYRAKANGKACYQVYDPSMHSQVLWRMRMEADLRKALEADEFEIHYMPIVEICTGKFKGIEALVRWRHPTLGLVTPDRFISLAEDTGLIISLGEWIVQAACMDAAHWPSDVKVAVNVSPIQLRKTNLFDVILCALVDSGLPPERLEIEITERVLLEKDGDYLSTLRQLQNLGVSVALDDFGTGYSSLGYLKQFRFDKIKIDRSFTGELLEKPECAAVVCAVIGMGRALDIVTVAEGVETEEQAMALRAAGLDQIQGWLIGRPLPASELRFENHRPAGGRIA